MSVRPKSIITFKGAKSSATDGRQLRAPAHARAKHACAGARLQLGSLTTPPTSRWVCESIFTLGPGAAGAQCWRPPQPDASATTWGLLRRQRRGAGANLGASHTGSTCRQAMEVSSSIHLPLAYAQGHCGRYLCCLFLGVVTHLHLVAYRQAAGAGLLPAPGGAHPHARSRAVRPVALHAPGGRKRARAVGGCGCGRAPSCEGRVCRSALLQAAPCCCSCPSCALRTAVSECGPLVLQAAGMCGGFCSLSTSALVVRKATRAILACRPSQPVATCREARSELISPYGDAFTLMGLFEEWLRIKQERGGGGGSSKVGRWAGVGCVRVRGVGGGGRCASARCCRCWIINTQTAP